MAGERAVSACAFSAAVGSKGKQEERDEMFDRESVCSGSRRGGIVLWNWILSQEFIVTHTHIHIHIDREAVQKAGTAAGEKIH